jgi:uncharacterized protein (TIGR02246 family)
MTRDETEVRDAMRRIYAGFDANDAERYTAGYASRTTVITPGVCLKSRDELRDTMKEYFDGALKGSKGLYDVQRIRFVTDDVAIVISLGSVLLAGQTEPSPTDLFYDTWVFSRASGDWEVEAFHSCPANPA